MLVANLDRWFVKFKVTASEGKAPGQGPLNPANGQAPFTPETKGAIEEVKNKAQFIFDVLLSLQERTCQPFEAPTGGAKHSSPSHRWARLRRIQTLAFFELRRQVGVTG